MELGSAPGANRTPPAKSASGEDRTLEMAGRGGDRTLRTLASRSNGQLTAIGGVGYAEKDRDFGRPSCGVVQCRRTSTVRAQIEKAPGYIAGPFVPDVATARAIFVAVEATKGSKEEKAKYPIIEVVDEGDHWGVFRTRPAPTKRLPNGDIAVVKEDGGGTLELGIDKCNGAIRGAYSR